MTENVIIRFMDSYLKKRYDHPFSDTASSIIALTSFSTFSAIHPSEGSPNNFKVSVGSVVATFVVKKIHIQPRHATTALHFTLRTVWT